MHRTHATKRNDDYNHALSRVPTMRAAPAGPDRLDHLRPVEDEVARLADFVLKVWSLAERYEERLRRIAPSMPTFAEQQTRVQTLRAAAERGRERLVTVGRGS